MTKHCKYHRSYGHNTKDCWVLKDKIEELIQAGCLAQFVKRPDNNLAGARHEGHQYDQHINHDADRRRDKAEDKDITSKDVNVNLSKNMKMKPTQQIRGAIKTITGKFSYGGLSSQSQKHHLHTIWDIDINCVDIQSPRSLFLVTFTDRDFKVTNPINQDDPMVVSIVIANFMVSKVLIDQGNYTDILY